MPQARPSSISPLGEASQSAARAGAPYNRAPQPVESSGFLKVVTPDDLTSFEKAENERRARDRQERETAAARLTEAEVSSLAAFVRHRYHYFRTERQTRGTEHALLQSLRTFRGQYNPSILAEIQKFGGSTVYSRVVAGKCRGASALLREVYLGGERPWALEPTPSPTVPPDIATAIDTVLTAERAELLLLGQQLPEDVILAREAELKAAASARVRELAEEAAIASTRRVNDLLEEGGFYNALKEFLQDLPIFPYAVLKGPTVRMLTDVRWSEDGTPKVTKRAKFCWSRVSPFDFFWSPGSSSTDRAEVIERWKVSRAELNACRGVKGYITEAIDSALDSYGRGGLSDWLNESDTERAWIERKEDPQQNRSGLIDAIEYHGPVQGRVLSKGGIPVEDFVPTDHEYNPLADYMVQVILVGAYVIKVSANPDPLKRHPYYVTSYEKVPGAIPGHGLPEILASEEAVANATLRALVNNLSISSGPQVVINTEQLDPAEEDDQLEPWKRWHVINDPRGRSSSSPITFFQPQSNAQELLMVYNAVMSMADENSALPRYQTGGSKASGAARTASGLSMLTQASNRVMMQVASNIDEDIFGPALRKLYDLLMLTDDTGILRGDENVTVRGATRMAQKETDRMRQLEMLQMTANPVDLQILGPEGRAELLRSVSRNIGLSGEDIVPSRDEMKIKQALQQAQQQQPQDQPPAALANPPARPGSGAGGLEAETDNAMRVAT